MQVNDSPRCDRENDQAKRGLEGEKLFDATINDGNDTSSSESDKTKDEGEREVEKIVDKSRIGKTRHVYYRVRWKGFEEKDNT